MKRKTRNQIVFVNGLMIWGGFMFIATNLIFLLRNRDADCQVIMDHLLFSAVAAPVFGILFGVVFWTWYRRQGVGR